MTFEQLQYGDVFFIDGAPYQVYRKHIRILACLHLDPVTYQHVPDPNEETGIKTSMFSDLRVNINNATGQEYNDYLERIRTHGNER